MRAGFAIALCVVALAAQPATAQEALTPEQIREWIEVQLNGVARTAFSEPAHIDVDGNLVVVFDVNSTVLTQTTQDTLRAFVTATGGLTNVRFIVAGHTDATGAEPYNMTLSERRARAVVDFLAQLGMDPRVFETVGRGELEPAFPLVQPDPFSPLNRRVEVTVLRVTG